MWEAFGGWQWERWFDTDKRPFTIQSNYIWLFSLTDEGEPRIMVLLSEWLALPETREKWGWEECPECEGKGDVTPYGVNKNEFYCQNCNGTGRIVAKWAKEE